MSVDERRWLIFDGPVDAIWIENMNTVLDDNKKLCLTSGEVIAMTRNMNMIFEPMDLLVASPATVSRCGMVFMQPHEMGWNPVYTSWKLKLPTTFKEENVKALDSVVDVIVQPTLDYLRGSCAEYAVSQDQNLVVSMLRILRTLLSCFDDEKFYESCDKKQVQKTIESSFLFACIWSLCCTVQTDYRRPFDKYFKAVVAGQVEGIAKLKHRISPPVFDKGIIYDYCYTPETDKWCVWTDFTNKDELDKFPKNSVPQEIVVTTSDKIKYSHLLELLVLAEIPTLFVGPTGTGKTKYIQTVLNEKLPQDKWKVIEIGFSARTHCNQVQEIVDNKLGKIRKGIFGPGFGKKAAIFVDDLNMPKVETFGAQPPIEILRQCMDQGGWYDLRDAAHPFKKLVDVT